MSLSSFFTGAPAKFKVTFADADTRQTVTTKVNEKDVEQYLFSASDNVCGTVRLPPLPCRTAALPCASPRARPQLLTLRLCAASQVDIEVTGGKKMEHTGIKIELIGHIGAPCCHPDPPPSDLARATVRG